LLTRPAPGQLPPTPVVPPAKGDSTIEVPAPPAPPEVRDGQEPPAPIHVDTTESDARRARYRARLAAVPLPPTVLVDTGVAANTQPGWAAALGRFWLVRGRGLWLGGIAIAMALFAQRLVTGDRAILLSIHWYAAAIFLMIIGWLGTYQNRTFLTLPVLRRAAAGTLPVRPHIEPGAARRPRLGLRLLPRALAARMGDRWRYGVAFLALALNLYSANQLRSDYYSTGGGLGWVISLILLVLAFVGERRHPARDADAGADAVDVERRTDWRLPPRIEWAIFLGLFVLAFVLRLYRLDDWTTGMHGDEGEAGMDAINILEGHPVSPFLTGWFSQPNFYYWGIALTMKVFGTGMGGLRMFALLFGVLMLLPFYPLVRQWFGVRVAILATAFLAISDVAIHFSRQEFSNITTPTLLVFGFFFLFRGLRNMRTLEFILAGYAFMLSLYFYLGGRLTPILVIGVFGYLFLLLPIVRLPGVYRAVRARLPGVGRGAALSQAVAEQLRGVTHYSRQIIICAVACLCLVSPWLVYFVDHQAEWNGRSADKLIFNNEGRMAAQYPTAKHEPLYIGLRAPRPDDIYPFSPIVFEQTPNSIKLTDDGFWAEVLWGQTTTTLSILTYRFDASSVYTFTQEPVAKPIEAALIILGIAWALWRWRDTRMAVLSMWFWSTVFIGGVLTIDAPYMARLVGIIPTLAVFAAIPLGKISGEFVAVLGQWDWRPRMRRVGQVVGGAMLATLLFWLLAQNYTDYYFLYTASWPFTEVTGQAYFVRQMNTQVTAEGRPTPKYYELGMHLIYWGHGDNRFLNHGTEGLDMTNPSQELPIINNGDKDVVFEVWDLNKHYLPVLKAYYPDGVQTPFYYSKDGRSNFLFTSYRVTKEQIDAQRFLLASYTPANGPAIERQEPALGSNSPPPANLSYPVTARWTGGMVAPGYGKYRFRLSSPDQARLMIDNVTVLTTTTAMAQAEGEVILAYGLHDVRLEGILPGAAAQVHLEWATGGSGYGAVPHQVLWGGPGKGLIGRIQALGQGDPLALDLPDPPPAPAPPPFLRRVDGFLGFRDFPSAMGTGGGTSAAWSGTLLVPEDGEYEFDTYTTGDSVVYIDGTQVVNNRQNGGGPRNAPGRVALTAGPHRYDLRFTYTGGFGYLEAFWTPPGQERQLIGPTVLHTDEGAWLPGTINDPGNVNVELQLGNKAKIPTPDKVINIRSEVKGARGIALDKQGNIYVADTGHHRVAVFDKDGKLVRAIGSEGSEAGQFGDPEDVAIGPDDLLYVLESSSPSRVQVFSLDGKFQRVLADGFCSPAGFTVGPDGMIYVANTCAGRVDKFAPTGEAKAQFTGGDNPSTRFEQPVDVAVSKAGLIYVADLRHRIVMLDANGAIQKSWPVQVGGNLGAANLNLLQDMLYLTNPDRNTVAVIDPATGRSDLRGAGGQDPGQFSEPTGVAAGPDGRLYVMDSDNGRIEVFPAAAIGLEP
jgi:DNA-binding beta-propeller fold protein YncE